MQTLGSARKSVIPQQYGHFIVTVIRGLSTVTELSELYLQNLVRCWPSKQMTRPVSCGVKKIEMMALMPYPTEVADR